MRPRRSRHWRMRHRAPSWDGKPAPIDHDPARAMEGFDDLPAEVRAILRDACSSMLAGWFADCVEHGVPLDRIRRGTILADLQEIKAKRAAAGLPLDPFTERLIEAVTPKANRERTGR